jgi:hypothetical protein
MAIYSLNHRTVGRSTHAPRTAGCHVRYITRPQAATCILGARMPLDPAKARAWMDTQEGRDRINARVIDKIMVALPIELSHAQRIELVRDFAEGASHGRVPWIAGIHDGPADSDNPHAHIIFRDRDIQTGRRVMELSEKGSTSRLRVAWQDYSNRALENAGVESRIDHRSLEARGIDREAGIHVGQAAQVLAVNGEQPTSKVREVGRIVGGERALVTVDYPAIDSGKTRLDENDERMARNRMRIQAATGQDVDWTDRGGMAAQQRSAMEWVRAARDKALTSHKRNARLRAFLTDRSAGNDLDGPEIDGES